MGNGENFIMRNLIVSNVFQEGTSGPSNESFFI